MRRLALVASIGTLVLVASAASSASTQPFFVGFSEDLPKEIGAVATAPAAELGGSAFRLTTLWAPGQAALAPAERAKLDRATAAAGGQRIVLAVYGGSGASAPQTAAARSEYCAFVRTVLVAYPSIRDVVVWNEPNKSLFWSPQAGAPAAYAALLAHCHDVLHAAIPAVNVIGLALSSTGNDNAGSTSPGAFIREVGDAYRASGRTQRLLDTVAHHPYGLTAAERPWRRHIAAKPIGLGDWNKLMANLALAFEGTGQPLPGSGGVTIWYTEGGSQTAVDPGKTGSYTGTETVEAIPDHVGGEPDAPAPAETSDAPDQTTQALDAIRLAACQPHVAAYFNFLLADEPRLEGWQSGAFWADLTPKDSAPAFRRAIAEATAGTVDCDALKGGRPSGDYRAPSVPGAVTATALSSPLRVQVSWSAAADDASAISYRVYRNGAHVGTTAETTWTNTAVAPQTTYSYAVRALDDAGNLGEQSDPATVTTPAEEPPPPPPPPPPLPPPPPASGGGGSAVPPNLRLHLATTPAVPVAGAAVDVLATVTADAAGGSGIGVVLRIELPPGARLLGPPAVERGSGCRGETTVVCELDFLPNGFSTPIRFSLLAPQAGRLAAVVVHGQTDAVPADNEASFEIAPARAPLAAPTPAAPNRAPTAPSRLRAATAAGRLTLRWGASRDDRGVRAYLVYRDGKLRRSVRALVAREPLLRGRHVYVVRAVDAAGLRSAPARIVVRGR